MYIAKNITQKTKQNKQKTSKEKQQRKNKQITLLKRNQLNKQVLNVNKIVPEAEAFSFQLSGVTSYITVGNVVRSYNGTHYL